MHRDCDRVDADELPARYTTGRLSEDEASEFEQHLMSCDVCRNRVTEAAELRAALRSRSSNRLVLPAGALAAAVVTFLFLQPSNVQRLGKVGEAPRLTTMDVRANADSAAALLADGLRAYETHDYEAAARHLERGFALQPHAGAAFFLGAARLMSGQPDSAVVAFRHVIAADDPAYTSEARYYSAKAWLQLGNGDSALAQLRSSDRRSHALADSIRNVLR